MHDVTVRRLPNKLDIHLQVTEPVEISHLYSGGDVEAQRREASTCLSIGIRARANASTTLNLNLINEQFHEFQRNFEHNATAIAQRVMLGPIQDLFSLDKPDSILQRFAKQISDGNKQGKDGLEQAMASLKRDLAPDNPQSPIAKACEFWTSGVRSITSELSLDNPTSGLSRMHKAVTDPLEKMAAGMAAMTARRDADSRSPAKGNTFQDQVGELVGSFAAARGDLFEDVTAIAGRNGKAKKGDFVSTLGATHAAGGERIPIEAKNEAGYSTTRMAKELKEACENRGGNFGLFVMSVDTAPAGMRPFQKCDHGALVLWNPNDRTTDTLVEMGYDLCAALAVRQQEQKKGRELDFSGIDHCVADIERDAEAFDKIKTKATSAQTSIGQIIDLAKTHSETFVGHLVRLRDATSAVRSTARGPKSASSADKIPF